MENASTHDTLSLRTLMGRPLRAVTLLIGRVREFTEPVVAAGCTAAIGRPSPTTVFVLAVLIELGTLLRAAGRPGKGALHDSAGAGRISRLCAFAHGVFSDQQSDGG